ncbi:MAG: tRNA pseudouridine(38-40) synthase TruA [Oscillospiraceae bacterium]|nr:tRNA pseudouridine(38-40) synthase TruA [Oscillospiraceae bacterium]
MRNILMKLSYIGTAYHGSQVQANALSVTEVVQDAMETVLGRREDVKGCSRTDSGVHANCYCMNFRTESEISLYALKRRLNALLPEDIGVLECRQVPPDFHARYSCVGKRYRYLIWNADGKNPFYRGRALEYWQALKLEQLQPVCEMLCGTHDFRGFCSSKTDQENTVRTVYRCEVERQGDLVILTIEGDGFLYNMVRIIVGTLLRVNEGKLGMEQVRRALEERDRSLAGITAPACGLYLDEVFYTRPAGWA